MEKTLGSGGFTGLSFAIQVGLVPIPFLSSIQSGILGTGLLTQSKSGRYVLAGEIIVASAVGTWYCGSCATAPILQGALAGELSLGATGGLSAARNGGDISKGVLFGTATGAVVGGLSGGTLSKFGLLNPAGGVIFPSLGTLDTFVAGTAVSGAIFGAGKGATEAYAGGRGNFRSIIGGASRAGIEGAITSPFTTAFFTALGLPFGGGKSDTPYKDFSFPFSAPDGKGLGDVVPYGITLPRRLTLSVLESGIRVGFSEITR